MACCSGNWWGDGTSRNDVSPYECSGTPGPLEGSLNIRTGTHRFGTSRHFTLKDELTGHWMASLPYLRLQQSLQKTTPSGLSQQHDTELNMYLQVSSSL